MEQQQQLDPKLAKNSSWLEGEEEEEVSVDLVARHTSSRHPPNGVEATTTSPSPSPSAELEPHTNGTTTGKCEHEVEEKEDEPATANGGDQNEEVVGENGEGDGHSVYFDKLEGDGHSVYFDKLEGIWKCRHCNWTHKSGSPCIDDNRYPEGYLHMDMTQWGPCFGLDTKGTEPTNGTYEMQSEILDIPSIDINHQKLKILEEEKVFSLSPAPVEHLHEETNGSINHFENETEVDDNVDSITEIEDLVDLDVEGVIEKQNTHDLYCPNCNSCITKRVILVRRRRAKVSIRHKPKRGIKLDPIPDSSGFSGSDDTPEILSDASPAAPTDAQNYSREQEQEAFSCLSCFSLFIPIGNGCFKIFDFFTRGRQTEQAQSPQEIRQEENTQSPPEIRQTQQEIHLIENTQTLVQVSHDDDTQSPQKISPDVNMSSPQHINHIEDAQKPKAISGNEDTQSPQKISCNENAPSSQDIKQNDSKQSPQKIPTDRKKWIFSIFSSHESKETVEREYSAVQSGGHTTIVQSAAVTTSSIINKDYINGAAIYPKEPGISDIFSSTNSSLLDKLKAQSAEQKPDADMFQRDVGDNEIKDIETGLLEPLLPPNTEVAPSSQTRTETERTGADVGEVREWEILKSIVYGGLIESITSLGVVASAAGAGANTLNILALGVANLIGGLILICHNLRDLKNDQSRGASEVEEDRYQALLGRRQHFVWHATFAILSFLVFGLVPPAVYGFSFRKSDDKDLKLAAVAGASLVCIILLALGKGHIRKPHRTYFRTLSYYVVLTVTVSGISYVVGQLIKRLLEQLGLFESSSTLSMPFLETVPMVSGRVSY